MDQLVGWSAFCWRMVESLPDASCNRQFWFLLCCMLASAQASYVFTAQWSFLGTRRRWLRAVRSTCRQCYRSREDPSCRLQINSKPIGDAPEHIRTRTDTHVLAWFICPRTRFAGATIYRLRIILPLQQCTNLDTIWCSPLLPDWLSLDYQACL